MRQDWIEPFGVEIVVDDLMAGRFEFIDSGGGDGVAEAAGMLMAEEDEDVHGDSGLGAVSWPKWNRAVTLRRPYGCPATDQVVPG